MWRGFAGDSADIYVQGKVEGAGAVFREAGHQQAERFECLGHVQAADIQRTQSETVEDSRDEHLGLSIVGCDERVEASAQGKDGAETGVERNRTSVEEGERVAGE